MSGPSERHVKIPLGGTCRIWEKGSGNPLAIFAGGAGYQRWTPYLELLSQQRKVVLISQPGYPGSGPGHHDLDDTCDWITMGHDLLEAADVVGADLAGESAGGMLAAELAAFSDTHIRRLILVGAAGLYDEAEPFVNPFAVRPNDIASLVSSNREAFDEAFASPQGDEDETTEYEITAYRAVESCSRLIWPMGDRGLKKRLHRIKCPTLLLWGSEDKVVPASYAKRFADGISGPTEIRSIEGAGHTVTVDKPSEAAEAVLAFTA